MTTRSLDFELDRDELQDHVDAAAARGTIRLGERELIITFGIEQGSSERDAADEAPPAGATRIALADVVEVSMTGGALKSPRLLLEVKREELLGAVPWADGCHCVLRFRHADGQHLRELIEEIEVQMAQLESDDTKR